MKECGTNEACLYVNIQVRCTKFECRKDVHFKTQPGPVANNATSRSPDGNWTRDLWISNLYRRRCSNEAKSLPITKSYLTASPRIEPNAPGLTYQCSDPWAIETIETRYVRTVSVNGGYLIHHTVERSSSVQGQSQLWPKLV